MFKHIEQRNYRQTRKNPLINKCTFDFVRQDNAEI